MTMIMIMAMVVMMIMVEVCSMRLVSLLLSMVMVRCWKINSEVRQDLLELILTQTFNGEHHTKAEEDPD